MTQNHMTQNDGSLFEAFLNQHDGEAWARVVSSLLPSIHEVDRAAAQIWFAFFPVDLARALNEAQDPEKLAGELQMLGKYDLKDQIDTSHAFLYGHRFWPQVRNAVRAHASSLGAPASLDLEAQIREVATGVSAHTQVDVSLVLGITAVAFMTLQQAA
jgi:hypothetical protein